MSWEPYYCASIKNNLRRKTWKALPLSYYPIIVTLRCIGFKQGEFRAADQSDVFFRIFLWTKQYLTLYKTWLLRWYQHNKSKKLGANILSTQNVLLWRGWKGLYVAMAILPVSSTIFFITSKLSSFPKRRISF